MSITTPAVRLATVLAAASVALAARPAAAIVKFTDVAAECGISGYDMAPGMAGGVAAADYDGDGDVDLFVPTRAGLAARLYRNLGDGTFEEIASDVGLASLENHRGGLWFDYDGDGDLDLAVLGDDHGQGKVFVSSTLKLHRQEADGTFTDVTVEAGLFGRLYPMPGEPGYDLLNHASCLAAGDLDGDGDLELFATFWRGNAHLYRNEGDGTFTDITAGSGISEDFEYYWQSVMHDFDGDGLLDIFSAIDFLTTDLYLNQGDGTFVNVAPELGIENDNCNDMGVTIGDYDGDGDMDVFASNIAAPEYCRNYLFRNDSADGVLAFGETAVEVGVDASGWGWGATFADVSGDGRLDLAVTNGFDGFPDPTALFIQQPGERITFEEVGEVAGVADTDWGSCLISLDFDRDGDLDLAQTCNVDGPFRMLQSDLSQGDEAVSWLTVRPRIEGTNSHAIGATVEIVSGDRSQVRPILAGTSMLGQEPAEAHVSLPAGTVDRVIVRWPGGGERIVRPAGIDRILTVTRWACPGDVDDDGSVGPADLTALFAAWGEADGVRADLDGNGRVDVADLLETLAAWGDCEG